MIPEFYKVGKTYKIVGRKELLTLVEVDKQMAKFIWYGGLKYHTYHHGKQFPFMYRNVKDL